MVFGSISNACSLMGCSLDVLKKDKELLIFPLVSGLATLPGVGDLCRRGVVGGPPR